MSRAFRWSIVGFQEDGKSVTLLETDSADLAKQAFELHGQVIPEHNGKGLARIVRLELHEDRIVDKTSFLVSP